MTVTFPFRIDPGTAALALDRARKVTATVPWFAHTSAFAPRPHNVIHPLINGERAFGAVEAALLAATQSIDIISWGFDPSIWKDLFAQFFENNMINTRTFTPALAFA